MTIRIHCFFAALVVICAATVTHAQHSLQVDDGHGIYSVIQGNAPGGTYILAPGGGTLITSVSLAQSMWLVQGNLNNGVTDGVDNVLGSLANSQLLPLHIIVGGVDAVRYVPGPVTPNIIAGYSGNTVDQTYDGNVIGGGGKSGVGINQIVYGSYNVIGGGWQNSVYGLGQDNDANVIAGGAMNRAGDDASSQGGYDVVGGGLFNWALGSGGQNTGFNTICGGNSNYAVAGDGLNSGNNFIGGGYTNSAAGTQYTGSGYNVVCGGYNNSATPAGFAEGANFVGGGEENHASGGNATVCGGSRNVASGAGAVIAGGGFNGSAESGNTAAGAASFIGGGYTNVADDDYSVISGGASNFTSGDNADITTCFNTIAGGYSCVASGLSGLSLSGYNTVGGGDANEASPANTGSSFGGNTVSGGWGNLASGGGATVVGGVNNVASGSFSTAIGDASIAANIGQFTQASGNFTTNGDAQTSVFVLRNETTNNAVTSLYLDGSGTPIAMTSNGAMTFQIMIVGKTQGSPAVVGGWVINGVAYDNNGTSLIVNSTLTILNTPPGWGTPSISGNLGGTLDIKVTGKAGTVINWVARVQTAEVVF